MANLDIHNFEKTKIGSIEVDDKLLNTPLMEYLIKDSITAYKATLRQGTRGTKTTSTVSGSTRKLFKQKGTGRARAGSSKAVQRRHGATQFGPQPKSFAIKINKKTNKLALLSTISEIIRQNKLQVFDNFKLDQSKSSQIKKLITNWEAKSLLVIDEGQTDQNFIMASRNFKNLKIATSSAINSFDLFKYNKIWVSKEAMGKINKRFSDE